MGIINSHLKGTTKRWASIFKIVKYIYIYFFSFYGFIFSLSSEVHSSALSLILAPVEPKAHSNALWFSINPASMKSQGANAEKRANLPVYTISSYTEALAPAPKNPQLPPTHNMFAEVFMLNKVIVSSGPALPFVLLLLLKPVSSCVTPNSGEVWKMEEGNHAKWTYSPACRKITGGWTISHLPLLTELQISHLHEQKVTRNLTKEQQKEEIMWSLKTEKEGENKFLHLSQGFFYYKSLSLFSI